MFYWAAALVLATLFAFFLAIGGFAAGKILFFVFAIVAVVCFFIGIANIR